MLSPIRQKTDWDISTHHRRRRQISHPAPLAKNKVLPLIIDPLPLSGVAAAAMYDGGQILFQQPTMVFRKNPYDAEDLCDALQTVLLRLVPVQWSSNFREQSDENPELPMAVYAVMKKEQAVLWK
jgi:hypothetical protein